MENNTITPQFSLKTLLYKLPPKLFLITNTIPVSYTHLDVYKRQIVGCTDEPEKAEDILQSAREELVRDNQDLVFMTADLELQGKSMVFGAVDSLSLIHI